MTQLRPSVERQGTAQVPAYERSGTPFSHTRVWAAASLNPFVVSYGFFVIDFGLSWPWAVCVVLVGCVAGYVLLGFVAALGPAAGQPTMALSRRVFGTAGNVLPCSISYVALLGWGAVNLVLAVLTAVAFNDRFVHGAAGHVRLVCFVVLASAVVTAAVCGYRLIMALQPWFACVAAAAVAGYVFLTGSLVQLPEGILRPSCAQLVGATVFVIAAGGLAWVMAGADYSRYLPESSKVRSVRVWTAIGGGLPSAALMLYGVLLCASRPDVGEEVRRNPVGALADVAPAWYGPVFLLVAMVGFTSNAAVNLYSSGLNLLALGAPLRQPAAMAASGALTVAAGGHVVFVSPKFSATFESVLDLLGVPIAAWCAVFLVAAASTADWSAPPDPSLAFGRVAAVIGASFAGLGWIDPADPAFRSLAGYLLTDQARQQGWGAANTGVLAAFVLGLVFVRVFAFRPSGTRRA
ncbi:permease for cytosine/purines uracil thiamine allantoin [Segniliparus rotundus DSM 44985]|uniref:Permease for cytosine/purines uracil thiamine allantoin n=1 Tax=Segniliparus rotundus (strain ATCC BAA-972 / CDC 1076 / CIP 108378 / DSM 44985 / JCM 13578) TaxID=640132 RepID=D6ZEF6_SEGRD|nr:cytosine permease [Segniliparus rotundus]ADG99432.1 permease for cytosine/purines uracil thiamine allantoin [Segniliparus rotundus DSM 44985]